MDGVAEREPVDFAKRFAATKGRPIRNRMASARVTAAELERLEGAARGEGKLLAEWAREVLLPRSGACERGRRFHRVGFDADAAQQRSEGGGDRSKDDRRELPGDPDGHPGRQKKVAADLMRQYTNRDEREQ